MPRFFIDGEINAPAPGGAVILTGSDARHISVLRKKIGDAVDIVAGGRLYACKISSIEPDRVLAEIASGGALPPEPPVAATLFQAVPKAAKMELVIQKAVELGAAGVVPVVTERSVASPGENKAARWRKIAEAAAKQCGRGIIPSVHAPVGLEAAAAMLGRLDDAYAAWELEDGVTASEIFAASRGKTAGIFIGPEGGLSHSEIDLLRSAGAKTFSLGKRILRAETAGFAALICLMAQRGEM